MQDLSVEAEQRAAEVIRRRAETGRKCGECSLCCKVFNIPELEKPAGRWCRHCDHTGCSIYDDRPLVCRAYACAWLISPEVKEEWYPLKSNMIIGGGNRHNVACLTVTVDPSFPNAWKKEPYYHQLKFFSSFLVVWVQIYPSKNWIILPDEDVEMGQAELLKFFASRVASNSTIEGLAKVSSAVHQIFSSI